VIVAWLERQHARVAEIRQPHTMDTTRCSVCAEVRVSSGAIDCAAAQVFVGVRQIERCHAREVGESHFDDLPAVRAEVTVACAIVERRSHECLADRIGFQYREVR